MGTTVCAVDSIVECAGAVIRGGDLLGQFVIVSILIHISVEGTVERSPSQRGPPRGALEVGLQMDVELFVVKVLDVESARLLVHLLLHAHLPFLSHLVDALLVVEVRVVVFAHTPEALPQAQVLRVDGDAVVVLFPPGSDEDPSALLLLQIKAGGIGHEHHVEDQTCKAKPGDDIEFGLGVDVVVEDRCRQGSELAHGGRKSVGGGTDGSRVHFCSRNECDRVGPELVEKR